MKIFINKLFFNRKYIFGKYLLKKYICIRHFRPNHSATANLITAFLTKFQQINSAINFSLVHITYNDKTTYL